MIPDELWVVHLADYGGPPIEAPSSRCSWPLMRPSSAKGAQRDGSALAAAIAAELDLPPDYRVAEGAFTRARLRERLSLAS